MLYVETIVIYMWLLITEVIEVIEATEVIMLIILCIILFRISCNFCIMLQIPKIILKIIPKIIVINS